jgi:hypothetical protein
VDKIKFVYIRESVLESIFKDTYTFGCMFALWYLNHRFCGGSWIINLTVAIMVLFCVHSLYRKKYTSKEATALLVEQARQDIKEAGDTCP